MKNHKLRGTESKIYSIKSLMAISVLTLTGCVQQYPISYYASPGDTIVLGLGGIQRNSSGSTSLEGTDLTITLTNNTTHIVTNIPSTGLKAFKAFPDYSSEANLDAITGPLPTVPFDGGWFVPVTLPSSSLSPGGYTISITSPTNKLVNTKWCFSIFCEGDLTQIPLQIITGSGTSVGGEYKQQFTYYYAAKDRLNVSPNQAPTNTVGGLQLVINFPSASYNADLPILALPYSHNPSISLQQNIVDNGNGTKSLIVLLSAPKGFVTVANRTPLTPVFSDLSLSFFFFLNSGAPNSTQQLADFQIDQTRSRYYDLNGNVITGLQPVMTYQ